MTDRSAGATSSRSALLGVISWRWVGVAFTHGGYELVIKIPTLFRALS
jgi:hypothetical protein